MPAQANPINATLERWTTAPYGAVEPRPACILPAAGFNEWQLNDAGQKHPVFIHLADQDVFGFAGLWDRSVRADGNNPHRMPAILAPAAYDAWLKGGAGEARAVLEPYPQDVMVAYEVSTRVNSPKNNGEQLIEPVKRAR